MNLEKAFMPSFNRQIEEVSENNLKVFVLILHLELMCFSTFQTKSLVSMSKLGVILISYSKKGSLLLKRH